MARVVTLTRNVTQAECPWLDEDLQVGTKVWIYTGCDYGCISPAGIAVTVKAAETPFFEVPLDAISERR